MALSPDALLTVGRRDVRDSERIVQLKDRQARILPKYRQRRRQSAVDWTPLELSSSAQRDDDDAVTSMLNDADVQAPTTDAQRSKHLLKPAESDQSQKPVGPSAEDFLGLLQPLTTIAVDDNVVDDNTANGLTTTLRFSNGDDYNIDIDEELNASSRLMLSRLFASNTLPGNGNGEPARITESDNRNDDDIDADDVTVCPHTRRERVASCCRSFFSFLASTVGLTCLLVVYTLFGGALFAGLEAQHERHVKTDVMTTRNDYVRQLWNITAQLNVLHPNNWSALAENLLERYADDVYVATKKKGWDGRQDIEDGDQQWSFAGSLLYAITVVTTIGTPNVGPQRTDNIALIA